MSLGLRIKVAGGMYNVGSTPKAGCIGGIGGNEPEGKTDGFLGA